MIGMCFYSEGDDQPETKECWNVEKKILNRV